MTSLLFVCTGNTCRSPLAEALARVEADRRHVDVQFSSAGTFAVSGSPASQLAVRAAKRRGTDLSVHRSRPVSPELLAMADLVIGMTPAHLQSLRSGHSRDVEVLLATDFLPADHVQRGQPISDPLGAGEEAYEEVATLLEECVSCMLDRLAEQE